MTLRTGILGGTFDPIHHGHLAIAEDARTALGLDQVLFIPAAQQPFKRDRLVSSATHRLAMVEQACLANDAFLPSAVEIERAGVSYSVTTLEMLNAGNYGALFFILGADALVDLPKWYQAARLPQLAQIVAVRRPGVEFNPAPLFEVLPALRQRLTMLDGPDLNISSTDIRQRVAEGRSVRYLTPDPIVEYIGRFGLYRQLVSPGTPKQ